MDKTSVLSALEEMAVLLELKGENPFKIRAFTNASRALQGISDDFEILIKSERLIEIKGIGKGIAEFIRNLAETGQSEELTLLRAEIPDGLLKMLKIPGMGPRKVRAVWEKLNITSVGELAYACTENRLVELEGFGLKTQQKIADGIEMIKKYSERHLLSDIIPQAEALLVSMRKNPDIIRCDLAGSLRRWKETIKDIDMLASADAENHPAIMKYFVSLPEAERVTASGSTKSSIVMKNGITAELRLVKDNEYPFALHHLTGSHEHNIAMRQYAGKLKFKMNEYGLYDGTSHQVECGSEEDIFQALKMQYIPPELRENYGEIEAALTGNIPDLVTQQDIQGMIHVHSNYSDGMSTISELAEACRALGYRYLVISDHSQSAAYAGGLTKEKIRQQIAEIDALNETFQDFTIFKSIESDILPDGRLDYEDEILELFDLIIASVHSRLKMTRTEATDRLIRAMQIPYLTILGHPTGRLLLAREGYPVEMNAIIDAAVSLGVSLELNANPRRLDTDWRYLKQARDRGIKISINPDAHRIEGFQDIHYGIGIARKGWLTRTDVLNCLSAEEFYEYSRKRRNNVT